MFGLEAWRLFEILFFKKKKNKNLYGSIQESQTWGAKLPATILSKSSGTITKYEVKRNPSKKYEGSTRLLKGTN